MEVHVIGWLMFVLTTMLNQNHDKMYIIYHIIITYRKIHKLYHSLTNLIYQSEFSNILYFPNKCLINTLSNSSRFSNFHQNVVS